MNKDIVEKLNLYIRVYVEVATQICSDIFLEYLDYSWH